MLCPAQTTAFTFKKRLSFRRTASVRSDTSPRTATEPRSQATSTASAPRCSLRASRETTAVTVSFPAGTAVSARMACTSVPACSAAALSDAASASSPFRSDSSSVFTPDRMVGMPFAWCGVLTVSAKTSMSGRFRLCRWARSVLPASERVEPQSMTTVLPP